jgi:hypothetical protein
MNMSRHTSENKIDAALQLLGRAHPADDFEQRLRLRLHQESFRPKKNFFAATSDFFLAQRLAFAATAATLACAAMIVGSIQHSHQRILPNSGVHLSAPESGLGAASSTHISPQPVIAPEHGRSRSERKAAGGRATVSRNAHKPSGVAVPASADPQKP